MSIATVLLTGFEPFNQDTINPSWEAVQQLDGWHTATLRVKSRQLPCVFGLANQHLIKAIEEFQPDVVIAVGLAGGRTDISLERVAINIDDARIPDNANQQPIDVAVIEGAPAAYFSTLPIKAIVQKMRQQGIPAAVSSTAGSFVCNHVFYGLMHHLHNAAKRAGRPMPRWGFIHIPSLPQQAVLTPNQPSMALTDIVRGLQLAIEISCSQQDDIKIAGGQIC